MKTKKQTELTFGELQPGDTFIFKSPAVAWVHLRICDVRTLDGEIVVNAVDLTTNRAGAFDGKTPVSRVNGALLLLTEVGQTDL